MDDKVKTEARKLINKLGFISITTENANGVAFTKLVEGENGVITKYRKGLDPTNEFIETVKYGEGWNFKID